MTNLPPSEPISPDPTLQPSPALVRSYRIRRIITVFVALVLLGCGLYEIYLWKRTPHDIPTIHAEGILKQRPEQPGGIDIPNQDVTAYQQIDGKEAKPSAGEHLLPPPETPQVSVPVSNNAPQSKASPAITPSPSIENLGSPPAIPIQTTVTAASPELPAETKTMQVPPPVSNPNPNPAPVSDAVHSQPAAPVPMGVEKTDTITPASPTATAPEPSSSPVPASSPAPAPSSQAAETPPEKVPPEETAAQQASTASTVPQASEKEPSSSTQSEKKNYSVQIASIPDEDMANHEMAIMQERYASQLNGSKLRLVKADLGARGIYYRVQTKAMSASAARDLCAALKNLKAGCIVVRP